MSRPIKITLGQAARQGAGFVTIWCQTEPRAPRRLSSAVHVCGHHVDIAIEAALQRWGPDRRLSDIRGVCTVCGGREIDVRAGRNPAYGPQG